MNWKRTLLFFLLFSILAGTLLYYALPGLLYPLRIDTVPSGAYVVPWMQPNPSIATLRLSTSPWDVEAAMTGALSLSMTFNISTREGLRVVPSTVYLGHDKDCLYIGGEFKGMFLNPHNDANTTMPNYFNILFDVHDNGVLTYPESGSNFPVFVYNDTWQTGGLYDDLVWAENWQETPSRPMWLYGEAYYSNKFHKGEPGMAMVNGFSEYDNVTGTLTIIFARTLRLPAISEINALQMRPGERWVMGFLFELGFGSWSGGDNVDGWPRNVYPYLSNDSSWWPKLAIDLTNPPKTIPGQPT